MTANKKTEATGSLCGYLSLKQLRERKGMSRAEVAEQVSSAVQRITPYSSVAVRGWELRGVTRGDVLSALADLYDVSMTDILAAGRIKSGGEKMSQKVSLIS